MIKVLENLYVGDLQDCENLKDNSEWSIIHACKTPCHQNSLNYTKFLPPSDPNYLIYEKEDHLYLNIVDMADIKPKFADPIFEKALSFIQQSKKQVLIHCNQGMSRSPAIALVHLARSGAIRNDTNETAHAEFNKIYPNYNPGLGVKQYLRERWNYLMNS